MIVDTVNISALPSQSEPVLTINGQQLPQIESALSFNDAYAETASQILVSNEDVNSLKMLPRDNPTQSQILNGPPANLVDAVIDAINSALYVTANKKLAEELTGSADRTANPGQDAEDGIEILMILTQGETGTTHATHVADRETQVDVGTIVHPITQDLELELNQATQTNYDTPSQSIENDTIKQAVMLLHEEGFHSQIIPQAVSGATKYNAEQDGVPVNTATVQTVVPDDTTNTETYPHEVRQENELNRKPETEPNHSPLMLIDPMAIKGADRYKAPLPVTKNELSMVGIDQEAKPASSSAVSTNAGESRVGDETEHSFPGRNRTLTVDLDPLSIQTETKLESAKNNSIANSSKVNINIADSIDYLEADTDQTIIKNKDDSGVIKNNSTEGTLVIPTRNKHEALQLETITAYKEQRLPNNEAARVTITQIKQNESSSFVAAAQSIENVEEFTSDRAKSANIHSQKQTTDNEFDKSRVNITKTAEITPKNQQSNAAQVQIPPDLAQGIHPISFPRVNTSINQEAHSRVTTSQVAINKQNENEIIVKNKQVALKASDELNRVNTDPKTSLKEEMERKKSSSINYQSVTEGTNETGGSEQTQPKNNVLRPPLQIIATENARDSKTLAISENLRFRALERQVIAAARDGANQIRMQLYPPGMGQIIIRLALEGSKLRLQIKTSSVEATNSLNEMKDALRSVLADSGFTITSLDVTDGDKDHNEERNREKNQSTSKALQNDHPDFSMELQA
jgi:hypothetical protein